MSLFLLFITYIFSIGYCLIPYCQPSNTSCWPTQDEINKFSNELNIDGSILVIKNLSDPQYIHLVTNVQNNRRISYPSFIILIKSHSDVQNCVLFASSHNIQLSILSTGHSYSGRSSANNSLQINLSNMQSYAINKDVSPPTFTAETGIRWGPIYGIINSTLPDYVIIGAGDNSVGPAGYSSLGGHSPIATRHGLSSDYITEYYIVDANANIVHVYNTSGNNQSIDNLYWSLRGGGASTFGVVLNITFQLIKVKDANKPNDVYTVITCSYPSYRQPLTRNDYMADVILENYFSYIQNGLDDSAGGYFITIDILELRQFYFVLTYNYFGDATYAQQNFLPLMLLDPENQNATKYCTVDEFNTFWDFWSLTVPDTNDGFLYILNDFIPKQNLTKDYALKFLTFLNDSTNIEQDGFGCGGTATVIGGYNNLNNFPYGVSSAVGAGFRSSYFSHSVGCGASTNSTEYISFGEKWEKIFQEYGNGIYSNEENRECDGCDWKQEFWQQSNYDKLLKVKQEFDPNQVFYCNHCVGSDIDG